MTRLTQGRRNCLSKADADGGGKTVSVDPRAMQSDLLHFVNSDPDRIGRSVGRSVRRRWSLLGLDLSPLKPDLIGIIAIYRRE